jgi:hypothetical protein
MNDGQSICSAMRSCTSTQQQLLARGTQNHVFTENSNKYCCIGAQPGRAKRGVLSGLYRLKNGFPSNKWDSIFSSAWSMILTGSWTQSSFHISNVQGRELTSKQWNHIHLHLIIRMQDNITALVLALMYI